MPRLSPKPSRNPDRPNPVPPLPHPSWNLEPVPAGPARTVSAAEFWRRLGF